MSSRRPRVSIVLPVRNGAGTVDRAIRSVVGQTWIDWELVVVDDGSTDGTVGMVHGWSKMDPRVRLIAAPATGLVAALIRGVSESRGELVARMDSDDEMKPERLAQQVAYLATHETVELVSCGVEFGGDREAHAGYAAHVDWLNSVVTSVQIMCARFVESPLAHPSVMWRREVWAEHGGYRDGEFPEDYELWLRWLDAGVRIAKVPEVLMKWQDSDGRLSRTDPRYSPEAFYRIKAPYIFRELERSAEGRQIWIAGSGRPTRKRVAWLEAAGVGLTGYVDLDPKKIGQRIQDKPVRSPDDLPPPEQAVVLSYVGSRGARKAVQEDLHRRGFKEGTDFWLCA